MPEKWGIPSCWGQINGDGLLMNAVLEGIFFVCLFN